MESYELRELADDPWLTEQCNRSYNGECSWTRCLVRGGYTRGKEPVDYDCATCEAKEMKAALHAAADEIDRLSRPDP